MQSAEAHRLPASFVILVFLVGLTLLLVGLFADPIEILKAVGFPVNKLHGERGQADLAIIRVVSLVVAATLAASPILLWKDPQILGKITAKAKGFIAVAIKLPLFTTLFLGAVLLAKGILQIALFTIGYRAYAGDDFARPLSADNWLQQVSSSFDPTAWLNLGSAYLPFPDYLFGLALAFHRDLYLTPKFINLVLSSIVVVAAYLLARELFGRAAGLLTALLCAFQPWIIWLGFSGMTSDLPSVIMIALFGVFFLRWLDNGHSTPLVAASVCLLMAAGMRYENWFFSVTFSLLVIYRLIVDFKMKSLAAPSAFTMLSAMVIANAFPVLHMGVSYYVLGDLVPAMQQTDSFRETAGGPIAKINMVLLALSAFPLEVVAIAAGVVLFLKFDRRRSVRNYLAVVAISFLLFAVAFKMQLPVRGAGPERNLLTYFILLLPFAGFLLAHFFRAAGRGYGVYPVFAALLLLVLGVFDLTRVFNYPAKKYDWDAFAAGWSLRMFQEIKMIPDDGKVIIEKEKLAGDDWIPFPILILANRPERFNLLDEGSLGKACQGGFQTQICKQQVLGGDFDMMILSSPEKVRAFEEVFTGRSWQIGKYRLFELRRFSKDKPNFESSQK